MKSIIILASIISSNFSFCCYYIETLSKVESCKTSKDRPDCNYIWRNNGRISTDIAAPKMNCKPRSGLLFCFMSWQPSQSWEGFNYITNTGYFYCQILLLLAMLQILILSFIKPALSLFFLLRCYALVRRSFLTDLIKNGLLQNIKQLENYKTVHSVIIILKIIIDLLSKSIWHWKNKVYWKLIYKM